MSAPVLDSRSTFRESRPGVSPRALAQHPLHKRGFQVVIAVDGKEALLAHACRASDLILMDVQMLEMDSLASAVGATKSFFTPAAPTQ